MEINIKLRMCVFIINWNIIKPADAEALKLKPIYIFFGLYLATVSGRLTLG